ncbi:uncharacterized protein rab44 isoform X2 [Thunnus thynnus]|uniref:uncharacterized protein rab44 isoform X2 n=1 Tax=Thunnus thynnus TaxID=8237 RepID=UPI0035294BDF
MSAQSGKKKRWGSRRRGGNQSERSEPDEFHVKDITSVVQANIPEENTESLNMLSNSDYSQLETKHPPSPELIGNRRKLGSSRRSKGRQHVTSVTEPYNKPREEVEENTSNETFEPTQMSLAIQPERHTELSQGNEHDILYVTHDSSLYSVTTQGYSSEVYNPSGSEVDLESLIPKNENLQAEHDQTETDCEVVSDSCKIMLGGTNKSDTLESAEVSDQVEQNAHHVGTSDFISSSLYLSSAVDQELIDQLKSREMPGEELPSVDSVTDTENKKRDDDTDLLRQDGNLQGNYLVSESYVKSEDIEFSSTPETTTDKSSFGENTEIENNVERATFSLPTEELSTNEELNERFNLSEVKDDQHSEDAVNKEHKQEVKATQMQEMHQIDYSSESVIHDATEKSDTCPEILIDQAEIRDTYQSELSVKSSDDSVPKQEISNPDENQDEHHSKERNMEALDQRNEDDHVSNKRKMGSSRRNKGRRHIKDSVAESYHKPTEEVDHVSNTKEPWISNIAPCQVYEGEGQVEDDIKPSAEEKVHQVKEGIISEFEEGKSSLQNLQSEINAPLDSQPQGDSISIEEQTDSSLNPIGNRRKMGSSRRNKGKQHIKDSVAESYHKPTEEVVENMRGSEAFETTKISLATEPIWQEELSQESEPEMTHDNSLYSATTPGYSSEVQNLTTTNHPETVFEGLLTKSENVQAHDDERETDSTVVSDVCKSVETMLEERDKSDTPQTEDISDQVKETSHLVGISALTSISVHSSSTADQQLNDQSNSREMSNEELPSVYSITDTENKERDDDTNMLRRDGILQVNYLTCESHVESEDEEFSTTPEVTTDKTSFGENTEIEYNVERATFSLPTEELSTNEELNEHFNLSEVKDDQHSEDAVNKVLVQEVKPTQMQEMHQIDYSSESVIHDATEKFDTCSENLIDQAEIRDTYQSGLSVKSPDDSVPKQEISNPDENQDEHHIKERNMEALDQRNEDDHVSNKRKMGSSRRNKGKRHIKDSVAESYHKPTEEVVENMRGSEAFETTKISLATEPVWQEQLSQEIEPEMTHDNSLYSATTPGYSSEVQNLTTTNHPETVLEGLLPESGNLQADDDERETDSAVVSHVCKSVETMLEERDKSDTPQTEDISDQVKETSHLVDISALTSISVHSSSTADQQLNDQSISREMSNEELPSVYSITDTENKERDDDTNLLRQDGILQVNYLTCESHVESEDVEFSTTPEVTTDKTSFGENTEIEYNVEQATFSLPTEVLSTNEGLNEHFNLSEVKDDQLSEDAVNKEHKQEVKASQIQEMHQIDYSSENVIQDATEKFDTCSENLIDQAEIRDTYQSELSVKSSDDSVPKQEISIPDENQDEHHIKERNMEALDQRNEDDHVSNTKEPWISNIAPCQVYEGEGQVEDDIQPSAEEKVHQEREELLHKVEEREYYLQNLQSEINATLDSQPQGDSISIEEQTDSSLNPIGNRRKMGSSRRNKGKRHIKDSAAESYHKPTEEVVENMRGSEAFETTKISLATEPVWQEELSQESEPEMTHDNSLYSATTPGYSSEVQNLTTTNHPETVLEGLLTKSENVQAHDDERKTDSTVVSDVCESVGTMLEERDKSDTPQTEDISDQVKETSHLVDISALTSISEHSSSTADQQLNDQSHSREMSNEELPSVYSITDTENKERDDNTNLLRQDGILQVNYLTRESHVESEDVEFSTTPEVTTDKTSFGENTEIENNVEQATFSLPTEELSTNEELNEHFNLSEVKDDQLSEDAVNKEHKQEVKASQMQEMHQTEYSSESVIHDATEKSDTCPEILIDQAEIRDTYQSELSVKSSDDSVPKQEISNPDENQDEHHSKERNMEALDQRNEDDHVSNTKEPWISNIAPCQVYEGEGQVEDDIQPSAEEKVHQEREELLHKVEEREYYLQNLQSEINATLDSQPQGDSISIEEQTDSSLNPIGNRRKMGSSRRNKGKRHIKDSAAESYHKPTEEVVENMRGSEAFETTKISLATEPVWQEELSQESEPEMTHDNSLYSATTPGYSSEVQNLTTTNHPETVLEGLLTKSENVQAHDDERKTDSTVVSDVCESVGTMLEERDKSDTPQTEDISDQVKETSHLVDISALTSISEHSSSTADQQLNDQSHSREMSNEELPSVYSITDTENKERDDNTNLLRQDGILQVNYLTRESHVESEDVEFSTTPEVTTDKTSFGENTEIENNVEQATFSLPTEELSTNEELNEHFNLSEVKDDQLSEDAVNKEHKQEVKASQMQEMHQIEYSSESVIHDATEKSDTCPENLIDQAEIRDTYQSELSVKSTDDSATEQDISNPDDKQDEHSIEESNMQALNQRNEDDHVSNTKEPWINNIAPCQVYEGEGQVEDDIQPSAEETVHQVKEGILSEFEEGKSSLQTQQSEINATLDSQPHGDSISIEEQTDSSFNPIRNRRKMGSSRRNKGRRYIKDPAAESYYEPTEEVVENMRGSEAFETTKISLATEPIWQEQLSQESEPEMTHDNSLYSATTPGYSSEVQNLTTTNHPETVLEGLLTKSENVQAHDDERKTDSTVVSDVCESVGTMLEERDKSDTPQTEDISDQVKETSHLVDISALTSISEHSSSTADQQLNDQSHSREMSNEELPSVYSITDTENKERDDNTNLLRQDGILQVNYLTCESHVESEDVEFSTTPEVTTDKTSFGENTEIEYNVEQATFSLPTEELSTNEELNEHFNLPEVKDDQHSEDAVNKEHKQEVKASQMQEMHQIDYSSESVIHDATEKSDTCPENLIDQAEIRDTYQSELSVKGTDDSATEQDISNPVDKQDDIQPSAEETVHQVKEGILSEFEEGKSSLQTQQSEINATLDSQPHGDSISIEEQTDSSFNPIRNRRKMGSSRRNKGRRYIKDPAAESYYEPTEEVVGNTRDNEILQAMKRSLIIEAPVEEKSVETMLEEMDKLDTSQTDEVSEQVKENAQEMPNEELPNVYSVTYTENKERDEDTELLGHHGNLQGNYLVSESHVQSAKYHENTEIVYSVEKAMISSPNGRLSTNEEQNEHFILAEVRDAQHSEDTVNKVHEQGDKPTQMHEMDQTDHSPFKEGKSSLHTLQSGTHSPLGSLHQDDSVSIKEQTHTGVNPTVNRRKMGSSRRHKGRQPVKDFVAVSDMDLKDEVIENTWGDEAFETMKMSSATETTRQEEFKDQTDPGFEPTEDIRRICSTVNEEDNTQNMQEEGTILSENVKDDSVKSNEEVSENVDDAHKSQQETQENSDYSENLQIKSKQRRRKLASNRRDLIRKLGKEMDNKDETEESNLHAESDIRNLDKVEKVAEIPIVVTTDVSQNEKAKLSLSTVYEEQEMNEASTVQDQEQMGHSSTCEMHSTERNMISGLDDLMALLPEESASFSEEVVNAIKSFQVPETDPGDRNVVVSVETPPVDDDKSTETFCETTQSDEKGPKDIKVIQGQDTNKKEALKQTTEAPGVAVADLEIVKSAIRGAEEGHKNVQDNIQEPKDVNEGAHNTNFEVKNSSPNLNQTNRRRKLGSSRRSQKKEVDNQATETNIGDAMTECVSGIKEKELQLQKEHKDGDSEPGKEKVFETVEYSHTGDSYTEPPSHQTVEENPAVSGQLVETELHLTPEDIPVKLATSPKYDAMSELAYEGRRRKLGSHRKSHGHQTAREGRIIEAETGRDVKTITDKSGIKTLEENREESEVIESDKKPSSNISISKTGEPVSERISVQHHYAEVRLGQESQKSLSLDNYKGANRYNVVMIGDSSVGKTSFMKRAQSGKFSFDLPASVGLDSCLWNVVVDGKPVVLQLWDTAGQERFHSITRQIFHKAQAFLLIYDITSSESFFAVRYWVDCIKEGAMDDVTVLLLGNKSDCSERKVATQEGEILAKEYNFDFMECSAATGENVVQSLEIVARLLSQKVDTTKDAVVLRKEPQQKKASGCC